MSKQFNVVAQKIIDNTVQTALFVDDELIKPFENYKNSSGKEISEELYKAFSNHNCLLDFYRFSNIEEFRELKRDIFKGRDLLILDWQLISEEPKHFHTLEILNKAIDANNLPFVYIYTKTPEKDFEDIIINIKAYFSDINKEESVLLKEKVLKVIEEKGEDFNDIKNNNESVFKELILNDDSEQFKKLQTVFDEIECHNEINRIIKEDIKE
ncbi:MAG: response regulator receiver domain [Nanoarchaeota archaeon]